MIYLDNAASSYPKPISVSRSMSNWLKNNGANPGRSGHKPSVNASLAVYKTRENISNLFGVSDVERIVFVPNATYGLNTLIQGVLKDGDHAVTTDLEHNSVLRPLNLLKDRGVSFDVAQVDFYNDDKTVENIKNLLKKNTKAVICTQCSNVCGKILPIKKISNILNDGISLIVDGSQGAGIIPTNLEELGVDYYCAPSHKGLLGPQGSGFIAVLSKIPYPVIAGGTGSESFDMHQPDYLPDALESGTLPTPVIVGFNEGLKTINSVGVDKIFEHKRILTRYLYENLLKIDGVINYFNYYDNSFIGTVCFNLINSHSDTISDYLSENSICVRSGIHCAPLFHKKMGTEDVGMVRVSFGCYNRKSDVDVLIKKINKYLKK